LHVQILYRCLDTLGFSIPPNPLTLLQEHAEHGFENRIRKAANIFPLGILWGSGVRPRLYCRGEDFSRPHLVIMTLRASVSTAPTLRSRISDQRGTCNLKRRKPNARR
jgi:hypothetical protein